MSKHVTTTIRYDGPALVGHEMDVQELASALLALAGMVQLANKRFNGDAASMKVLVKADIEQQCFQLDIHIVQSILDSARHLFGTENYKTAREIAEMLDLLLPGGVAALTGDVFWLWKRSAAAKEAPSVAITTEQHGGQTTLIQGNDGSAITVNNNVYLLATDPEMIELGKRVLRPLQRPGYETLGFYRDNRPTVVWNESEARDFIERAAPSPLPVGDPEPATNVTPIRAVVSVKTQRNEGAAQWEIKWASRAVWASMDDTEWLARFQSGQFHFDIPYWLDVSLKMATSRIDPDAEPKFAIKKVHSLINGSDGKQGDLLNDDTP